MGCFSFFAKKMVSNPLNMLSGFTNDILSDKKRKKDLEIKYNKNFKIDGEDEINILASSFMKMRDKVH